MQGYLKFKIMEVSACIPQFIKLYNDLVIFAGQNVVTKFHTHHAIEIMISFDSRCTLNTTEETASDRGLLLHHDVLHSVHSEGFVLFIYTSPETLLGKRLDHVLGANKLLAIHENVVDQIKIYIGDLINHEFPEADVIRYLTTLLVKDILQTETNYTPDIRITAVLNHIKTNLNRPVNHHELKEIACLSESRLLHLFKKEMGIPIRKYVLWCRLQQAIKIYLTGQTLTQSAQLAGFSDVAHLTRTFVSMFGMNPSQILKRFN